MRRRPLNSPAAGRAHVMCVPIVINFFVTFARFQQRYLKLWRRCLFGECFFYSFAKASPSSLLRKLSLKTLLKGSWAEFRFDFFLFASHLVFQTSQSRAIFNSLPLGFSSVARQRLQADPRHHIKTSKRFERDHVTVMIRLIFLSNILGTLGCGSRAALTWTDVHGLMAAFPAVLPKKIHIAFVSLVCCRACCFSHSTVWRAKRSDELITNTARNPTLRLTIT